MRKLNRQFYGPQIFHNPQSVKFLDKFVESIKHNTQMPSSLLRDRVGESEENAWSASFRQLLTNADGRHVFTQFLQSEYADENILYFNAIEQLAAQKTDDEFVKYARDVFETFVATEAPLEVISIN